MSALVAISIFAGGLVLGALAAYVTLRQLITVKASEAAASASAEARSAAARADDLAVRLASAEGQLSGKETELKSLHSELTQFKTERATFDTRLEELGRIHDRMKDAFASLSAEALKATSETFCRLPSGNLRGSRCFAKRPRRQRKIILRAEASTDLSQQTQLLSRALRSPAVRGRWGEMQLRRVIEVAGMVEHCDFDTQPRLEDGDQHVRPDVVIKLPGVKQSPSMQKCR